MKKFFKKAVLFLAIGAMTFTTTSCDEETIGTLIEIITNLTNMKGETYNYTASGKAEVLSKENTDEYTKTSGSFNYNGNIALTVNQTSANMVLPQFKVGDFTVSATTLSGLQLTSANSYTVISVPENGCSADSKLVLANGTTVEITNLYMEDVHVTSDAITIGTFQLWYGNNYEHVLSLTNVKGNVVAQ